MISLIETGGSWRDVGYDVGRGVRDQIQTAAASTRAELGGIEPAEVMGNVAPYLRITEEVAPDVIAELRGMAEGSGVPIATLFVLNAGAELVQSLGGVECTVVGITGAGTADGHVLLAHNEDATAGWGDLTYIINAQPEDAPAFIAFTYAGLLLHQGVNAAGLGSVGNALYARDARPGIPKLLQYRRAITRGTIEEAIRTVTDLDREDDLLNSRLRQTRVETLVEREWGSLDACGLRRLMADHANYPCSVCKHQRRRATSTTAPSARSSSTSPSALWACAGNPCRGEWREVRL